jgi:hypothetical protein
MIRPVPSIRQIGGVIDGPQLFRQAECITLKDSQRLQIYLQALRAERE